MQLRYFGTYRELKALLETLSEQELDQNVLVQEPTLYGDGEVNGATELYTDNKGRLILV